MKTISTTEPRTPRPDRRSAARAVLVAASMVVMPGCAGDRELDAEPTALDAWESKSQSVLAGDAPQARLIQTSAVDPKAAAELRDAAVDLLRKASDSTNPLLRKHVVEAFHAAPADMDEVVRLGLGDANPGVRFAAAMTVGTHRISSLATLVEPLVHDASQSVQAAAIFALRRCGRPVSLTPLGAMIMSDDPEVKGNTAWVLGMLGDPSALPMLRESIRSGTVRGSGERQQIVDLQIAEAMVRLGADREMEVIRAALFRPSEQAEIVALACQILGDLDDATAVPTLKDLASRSGRREAPAEVRLAATQALARIEPHPVLGAIPTSYLTSDRFELRAQAAATLGWIPGPEVRPALAALMGDPNAVVQVAAASAVLRSTEPMQAATADDGPLWPEP